jgi:Zn-dependent M28 family amino/carboxypeptidase
MSKTILICLLTLLLFSSGRAQQVDRTISTLEEISESVKLAPCDSKDRLAAVKTLFQSAGAKEDELLVKEFKKISNLVVTKKGKGPQTIIVGAHYDKTESGCGAIDNWTGISILVHLYRTMSKFDTERTYLFVAFDEEEKGLLGSDAMARAIPKSEREKYCSMVNIDSFGVAAPQSMTNISNSKMTKFAKNLAKELNYPFGEAPINNASSDSVSFTRQNIPSITFHGLDGKWQNYLHNKEDKVEKINMQSVYVGYRFILNFLAKIDAEDCGSFR